MKTLKLDSSIFETEVGVRLVKALQGNECDCKLRETPEQMVTHFVGISGWNEFIAEEQGLYYVKEITFNLDDNLKVDLIDLAYRGIAIKYPMSDGGLCTTHNVEEADIYDIEIGGGTWELDLTELSKIQGVTIGGEE
jgi:hypothetical protein